VTLVGRLVAPTGVEEGWVTVVSDRVAATGTGSPGEVHDRVDVPGLLLPGLVDMHCHGALGTAFGDDAGALAARHHHRHGTTTLLASLASAAPESLLAQVRALVPQWRGGLVDGVHLEGPYLAAACRGAHSADALRDPDPHELRRLLDAGQGSVRMVTLAPELDGAADLVREIVARDVVAAVGHTAATTVQTRRALDAGANVATHLFNGMAPLHHREPGPVLAVLDDDRTRCELIGDGVHLADDVLRWAWELLDPDRRILVSDASPATGLPDGELEAFDQTLRKDGLRVWTADGRTLAGSASTLLDVVRHVVAAGVPLHEAVRAASATPALAIGLADRGALAPGMRADVVVVDDRLQPRGVMRAGVWL